MTDEATKTFLAGARGELARVRSALSEVPGLKLKEELLNDLLVLYGEKPDAETAELEEAQSRTVPVSEASLKRMQTRADRADRAVPVQARAHAAAPRPAGAPTNYQMVYQVLLQAPDDGLTARLIVDEVRDKWWPGLVFDQIGPEFYRYVNEGRLNRDDRGKLTLTEKGRMIGRSPNGIRGRDMAVATKAKAIARKVAPAQPAKLTPEQIEELRAKAAASSAEDNKLMAFELGAQHVLMDAPHWRIADHLFQVMGSGCVPADKLLSVSRARNAGSPWIYVQDAVVTINRKIAFMRLEILPYERIGFFMKEVA